MMESAGLELVLAEVASRFATDCEVVRSWRSRTSDFYGIRLGDGREVVVKRVHEGRIPLSATQFEVNRLLVQRIGRSGIATIVPLAFLPKSQAVVMHRCDAESVGSVLRGVTSSPAKVDLVRRCARTLRGVHDGLSPLLPSESSSSDAVIEYARSRRPRVASAESVRAQAAEATAVIQYTDCGLYNMYVGRDGVIMVGDLPYAIGVVPAAHQLAWMVRSAVDACRAWGHSPTGLLRVAFDEYWSVCSPSSWSQEWWLTNMALCQYLVRYSRDAWVLGRYSVAFRRLLSSGGAFAQVAHGRSLK